MNWLKDYVLYYLWPFTDHPNDAPLFFSDFSDLISIIHANRMIILGDLKLHVDGQSDSFDT